VSEAAKERDMEMIAACGLVCSTCSACVAGRTADRELQEKTAAAWSAAYGIEVKPEDIICDGCQSAGPRLFSHCTVCDVRMCAHGKGYATCAECDEYNDCKTINGFFGFCPEAKPVLDGLRAK
jgi:hypothetical protein